MTGEPGGRTKGLIPFSYVLTLIVPVTALLFAFALHREGEERHAVGVLALGIVWTAVLVLFVL